MRWLRLEGAAHHATQQINRCFRSARCGHVFGRFRPERINDYAPFTPASIAGEAATYCSEDPRGLIQETIRSATAQRPRAGHGSTTSAQVFDSERKSR